MLNDCGGDRGAGAPIPRGHLLACPRNAAIAVEVVVHASSLPGNVTVALDLNASSTIVGGAVYGLRVYVARRGWRGAQERNAIETVWATGREL
jgi:uncharacterized membrane-anchored protein